MIGPVIYVTASGHEVRALVVARAVVVHGFVFDDEIEALEILSLVDDSEGTP